MDEGVFVLGPEIEKTAAEWAGPGRFIPRIVAVAPGRCRGVEGTGGGPAYPTMSCLRSGGRQER